MAAVETAVAPGLTACSKPKRAAEPARAAVVPNVSSRTRNAPPLKASSSPTAASIEAASAGMRSKRAESPCQPAIPISHNNTDHAGRSAERIGPHLRGSAALEQPYQQDVKSDQTRGECDRQRQRNPVGDSERDVPERPS